MKIVPLSEKTVAIQFSEKIFETYPETAIIAARWLAANPCPGQIAVVPSFAAVTVWFDPLLLRMQYGRATSFVQVVTEWLDTNLPHSFISDDHEMPTVSIPVAYGGTDGPDLPEVARTLGLTENEVVKHHIGSIYTVLMLGFLPGFPYLGFLPSELKLARKKTPELRVPAGSVAIADRFTGIYPQLSPGGWHLIGRTDFSLFSFERTPPAALQPGWKVQFVAN